MALLQQRAIDTHCPQQRCRGSDDACTGTSGAPCRRTLGGLSAGVARVQSAALASSLILSGQPFIVEHELAARLSWSDAEAIRACPLAREAKWYALVSPDGLFGHYDRQKWAVEAAEGSDACLRWRPLAGAFADAAAAAAAAATARPPRHVATADASLEDLWPLWQGVSAPPVPLPVARPYVYLRGTVAPAAASEFLQGTVFDELQRAGVLGGGPLSLSLYASPAGSQTNLHADEHSGFLVQVLGCKRLVLFRRGPASRSLRGETWGVTNAPVHRRSWFDSGIPEDWASLPPFAGLGGREVVVRPGEALYIPKGWFHDVLSRDAETLGAVLRCRD